MHVAATPLVVELPQGESVNVSVVVTNTSSLIDAYVVRVFGLDQRWVTTSTPRLSLFPGEDGTVDITVTLPPDFPSGSRALTVHVQGENDAEEFSLAQIMLDVGTRPQTTLRVEPTSVTGGNKASFSLVVGNEGNTTVQERVVGVDPEERTTIELEPGTVVLAPGRRDIVHAEVSGGRPWFGQPKPRVLSFSLGPDGPPVMATFLQRPRIGRWLISLLGLVTVAAVFAAVLTHTLDSVVDEARVEDALLNAALTDRQASEGETVSVSPASINGTVRLANGTGVSGVQAELYDAGNGTVAIGSAATGADGAFAFGRLGGGTYKVRLSGAGFNEQWYPASRTFADADEIEVPPGEPVQLDDIEIGGRPGSVSGEVITADPTGAVARLVVTGTLDEATSALLEEVDVSADGTFLFEEVPSPANYQLVVDKAGFATEIRDVAVRPAQAVEDIEIVLREGEGVISGLVQSPSGPLGAATIVASDGTVEVTTSSLTVDEVGHYDVRGLPTPGQYTLTFSRDGYSSETRTVSVAAGQPTTGVDVMLQDATGLISGTVSQDGVGAVGGVTVTITGGDDVEFTTTTASQGAVGAYRFEDLSIPATYTVSFSKDGLVPQTRLVDLDPLSGNVEATGVDATLVTEGAKVRGVVRNVDGTPIGGATITLTGGDEPLRMLSAHDPAGAFEFANLAPGTYTLSASLPGTSPAVELVNLLPAEVENVDITLAAEASITGLVERVNPQTGARVPAPPGMVVRLFLAERFPGTPNAALASTATGADGRYTFSGLDAPDDFVVAVYPDGTDGAEALDSALVQSRPSAEVQAQALVVPFGAAPPPPVPTTTIATTTTTQPPNPTTTVPTTEGTPPATEGTLG